MVTEISFFDKVKTSDTDMGMLENLEHGQALNSHVRLSLVLFFKPARDSHYD